MDTCFRTFERNRKVMLVALFCVLFFATAAKSCGKADLVRLNADAITSLQSALTIADAAYNSGFLSAETQREILAAGEKARKTLVAVNEFAASIPDGAIPDAESKLRILTALDAAIKQMDSLVDAGVFFKQDKGRQNYYRAARPARAAIVSIKAAILKLSTKPPTTHTEQPQTNKITWSSPPV